MTAGGRQAAGHAHKVPRVKVLRLSTLSPIMVTRWIIRSPIKSFKTKVLGTAVVPHSDGAFSPGLTDRKPRLSDPLRQVRQQRGTFAGRSSQRYGG